ncbi:hypothetical protein ACHAXT_009188 [Thalassiosira profunda]
MAAPSRLRVWALAARPHTLTASVAPVVVGYALTLQLVRRNGDAILQQIEHSCTSDDGGEGTCPSDAIGGDEHVLSTLAVLPLALQFAIFAGLIQLATNLHNDYADFVKGADTDERVGQARATQRGWLTPYETCRGCVLCLLGALVVGMHFLIPTSRQCAGGTEGGQLEYDPVIVFVVLSSLFNAVAYTGGPFPLGCLGLGNVSIGYSGLGDLFVFLYFGIVATVGVPYLYLTKVACFSPTNQSLTQQGPLQQLLHQSLLHSIPIGLLATAIIVVNNLRDRNTDVHAGKRTMAVRFGEAFARAEYLALVAGSYGFCIYFWFAESKQNEEVAWTHLLPLLSILLAIPQLRAVAFGGKDGQELNEHVGGTAKVQMVYCILMAMGLAVAAR